MVLALNFYESSMVQHPRKGCVAPKASDWRYTLTNTGANSNTKIEHITEIVVDLREIGPGSTTGSGTGSKRTERYQEQTRRGRTQTSGAKVNVDILQWISLETSTKL